MQAIRRPVASNSIHPLVVAPPSHASQASLPSASLPEAFCLDETVDSPTLERVASPSFIGEARTQPPTSPSMYEYAEAAPLQVGYVVDGRFTITKLIGKGGMGEVYLGKDLDGKEAIIKIGLNGNAGANLGLAKEADVYLAIDGTMGRIFPELIGRKTDLSGLSYLAIEYIKGQTLYRAMRKESLPLSRVIEVAMQLCGLEQLHQKGLVHRDLKPANIMLRKEGSVVVLDFGLTEKEGTTVSSFSGTPTYAAPEQFLMEPATYKNDIYAIGLILYEMLAGENPTFGNDLISTGVKKTTTELPKISTETLIIRFGMYNGALEGMAEKLNTIVHEMTAIDPEKREGKLGEVRQQLQAMLPAVRAIEEEVKRTLILI